MHAIIMAGGEGKRLRPITCTRPKPMVPILDKPVIDYCIEHLKLHGIFNVTATVHYMAETIKSHLGDGEALGVNLNYSYEDAPLGTAGSVRKACADDSGPVLVISGDAITDIDLSAAMEFHREKGAMATIVLFRVDVPMEYGIVITDGSGRVVRFLEKPDATEVFSDHANTGIYILEPEVISRIPRGRSYDFSKDLFPQLMKEGLPLYGYLAKGYWCDIGDIPQYLKAQRDLLDGKYALYSHKGRGQKAGGAVIEPSFIAQDAQLAEGCTAGPYAVLCGECAVDRGSTVKNSVLMPGVRVRADCELRGSVICERSHIDSGSSAFEGSVVGAGCYIGKNCTVRNDVLIWPAKRISSNSDIARNIVWSEDATAAEVCLTDGYCDCELTPGMVLEVGNAWTSALHKPPCTLAVGCDGELQSQMLRYALIAGCISQGADILDFGSTLCSAFQYGIRNLGAAGGAYISCPGNDAHYIRISLHDSKGAVIPPEAARKLKNAYRVDDKRPIVSDRLGIYLGMVDTEKAYEAYLKRETGINGTGKGGLRIVVRAEKRMFDMICRLLTPEGYELKLLASDQSLKEGVEVARAALGLSINPARDSIEAYFNGRTLHGHEIFAVLALALLQGGYSGTLAVTFDYPEEYGVLLEKQGARLLRTRTSADDLQKTALNGGEYRAALYEPEAVCISLAKLCAEGKLEEYTAMLPQVHTSERAVECGLKDAGRVLRRLGEGEEDEKIELLDGVRISREDGWVVARQNAQTNQFRVIAGSCNEEYSRELSDVYIKKIKGILNEPL